MFAALQSGFDCLRAYFLLVNEAGGRLKRGGVNKTDVTLQVLPNELVGLKAVWKVALEATEESA